MNTLHLSHLSTLFYTVLQIKIVYNVMKKSSYTPNFAIDISPKKTLLNMRVGETIIIPTKDIKSPTVRMAASRIEKRKEGKFFVTEQGMVNETRVTRLK